MKIILGRKLGMARVFDADGKHIAVTLVKTLPCLVSQIKTIEKDGYNSIQAKAIEKKGEKDKTVKTFEFKPKNIAPYKIGQKIETNQFVKDDVVCVTGTSKGKGFAGTIKRHGFHCGPKSHGGNNVREPGSIGAQQPQRVILGRRMAGKMGAETITIKNLTVVDVDGNILLISGAIPGPNKSVVKVYTDKLIEDVASEIEEELPEIEDADIKTEELVEQAKE